MNNFVATKIIFLLLLVAFSCTTFAESWSAIGRHGGCISFEQLSKLSKSNVFFTNVESLDNLKSNIESQGLEYTLEPMSPELKDVFNLNVPSEGLAMMITTSKNCEALAK